MTISRRLWLLLLVAAPQVAALAQLPAPAPVPVVAGEALPQTLTSRQIDNVVALGQVWGFLKYFHPAVAGGQRDWDAELLRQLPTMLACRTTAARSRALEAWLASLGPVPVCIPCAQPPAAPVRLLPDLRWAADARRFSAPLRRQLAYIQANRYQQAGYYVTPGNGRSPAFAHEEAYADQPCPAAGLRLLALCRYWSQVQYFFPYKYAIGADWNLVFPEFIPRLLAADTPLRYRHAVQELTARLHDGHAPLRPDAVLDSETGNYIATAVVQFIGEQAVVVRVRHDGLVPASPLQPGDVITHLDSVPVAELVAKRLPATAGSNRAAQLQVIARELLLGTTPQLTLGLLRATQPLTVSVPRLKYDALPPLKPVVADSLYRFLTPEVGYIDVARLTKAKLPLVMQAFRPTKGIIVDLRGYPREVLLTELAGYFVTKPTPFVSLAHYDASYPGRFLTAAADSFLLPPVGPAPYAGRLVVLVNSASLSLAEFTALALRATPHCTVLGTPTAGADGDVTQIVLPGNLRTGMSGTGIYYPDGRETQRIGIVPDIMLRPTTEGIRAGRDELRERAVELIQHGADPRKSGS